MKQKTAYLGLFSAVAIILGYVESLVPVFAGIPGIKLGLANLGVLFILKKYSFREAASGFCGAYSGDWVYVWESVQYPVQPGRGCAQYDGYDPYVKKDLFQSDRS